MQNTSKTTRKTPSAPRPTAAEAAADALADDVAEARAMDEVEARMAARRERAS